ncbi:MAG: metallophosphatase family protein [Actinomycetota bacterium]|nr:metallophosphatase family protein [Actinomycetota bacterium]
MLALLFDIHGNLPALDAALGDARAQGADRWLLGGDYAVFGGWPAETVARLRELPDATWIRGNVDRWAAGGAPDDEPARSGVQAARDLIDTQTIDWLGALPVSSALGDGTVAWHASPKNDLESFTDEPSAGEEELLAGSTATRLVFGHLHLSFERPGPGGVTLVGPGSVGVPLDGDHRAAYGLLHDDGSIERRRVEYDWAASAARIREVAAGAPWGDVIAGRIERASA